MGYHCPMKDGPRDLGDRVVWYMGGLIHREDGPAVEFKDGRKLWALDGKEVTEQEAAARREDTNRQAREQSDALWEQHQADELRQYHTGLKKRATVRSKPFSYKKSGTP
jgi:hypothetical protein